jgi:SAM-dependent methyltransferase
VLQTFDQKQQCLKVGTGLCIQRTRELMCLLVGVVGHFVIVVGFSKMKILKALFSANSKPLEEAVPETAARPETIAPGPWREKDGFRARMYSTYVAYQEHQVSKLGKLKLDEYNERLRRELASRVKRIPEITRGATVLCLGARLGPECQSFIDSGAVAIGIDLNPGVSNHFVVTGDFHDVQYADGSFDAVYTNALDHAFDLERVIAEARRVLKPSGVLIAEIVRGSKDDGGREPGDFESIWWERVDDVTARIERIGLTVRSRERFDWPWGGDQVVFVKTTD